MNERMRRFLDAVAAMSELAIWPPACGEWATMPGEPLPSTPEDGPEDRNPDAVPPLFTTSIELKETAR